MATIDKIPKCPPLRFPDFNDDWTQCCISDYGDIVTGSTPSTSDPENYQENGFLWASPADINESKFIQATKTTLSLKGFNSTRKLPPYTVLVVCIGSTIGKMAMSKTIMATNQQINSIVVCEKYSPEFVYYAIDSRFPQYLTSVAVQAVPIISKSTFGALESCAPSLAEQKKIADFLSLIDERIQSCSETIRELKNQKAALLNQLFSQKLRFPDFTDDWTQTTLGEIAERVTRKNNGHVTSRPLTISAQYGLIDQRDFFNKIVASTSLEGYYLLNKGEFAYNRSSSADYPWGAIKRLESYDNGALSTLYICFSLLQGYPSFIAHFFETSQWHEYIQSIAAEGARNHGLLNISVSDFFTLPISLPTLEEQKRIADFLSLIDERIEVEEQLLQQYEKQKRYLLKQMFV